MSSNWRTRGRHGENEANCVTKHTYITSAIITVTLGGVKTALANFISNGEAMFVCTTPGRQPFVISLAKFLFDVLMEEAITAWFDDHNNDQEKGAFVFHVHKINGVFCVDW